MQAVLFLSFLEKLKTQRSKSFFLWGNQDTVLSSRGLCSCRSLPWLFPELGYPLDPSKDWSFWLYFKVSCRTGGTIQVTENFDLDQNISCWRCILKAAFRCSKFFKFTNPSPLRTILTAFVLLSIQRSSENLPLSVSNVIYFICGHFLLLCVVHIGSGYSN